MCFVSSARNVNRLFITWKGGVGELSLGQVKHKDTKGKQKGNIVYSGFFGELFELNVYYKLCNVLRRRHVR